MQEAFIARWRGWLSWPKRLVLLYRSIRLIYCEFQIPQTAETPLQGVYIGEGLALAYYLKLYRADVCKRGTIPLWRMPGAIARARACFPIVLVEVNRILDFLLPVEGLRADSWVEQETDLTSSAYLRRKRGIEKGWGQKVRKHGYRHQLSRDARNLSCFYHEYYLPYANARHGEIASTRSIAALRNALDAGFLLQVWQGEHWVSGVVAGRVEKDSVILLAAGLHPSQWETMQDGALSAAYYFLFKWAEESGVRTVNFCGSRPNEMDGVFQHKKLWAAAPKHAPWHHTEIVFFLDRTIRLPEAIEKQLISNGAGFLRVEQMNHEALVPKSAKISAAP